MVDEVLGAVGRRDVELLGRRRDGRHRRPEHDAELDRGEADAASRAEHDQLLPRLHGRDRAQHVVRGAVRHAERRREPVVNAVGDVAHCIGGDDHLLGERTRDPRSEDMIADNRVGDPGADLFDHARVLAAGDERRRQRDLVLVGDEEDVGEVDGGRGHTDPNLTVTDRG